MAYTILTLLTIADLVIFIRSSRWLAPSIVPYWLLKRCNPGLLPMNVTQNSGTLLLRCILYTVLDAEPQPSVKRKRVCFHLKSSHS